MRRHGGDERDGARPGHLARSSFADLTDAARASRPSRSDAIGFRPIAGSSWLVSGVAVRGFLPAAGFFFAAAFFVVRRGVARAGAFRGSSAEEGHSSTHASITGQVPVRARRPVSMPRCPPGTISNLTSRELVSSGTRAFTDPAGAMLSLAPAKTSTGAVMSASESVRLVEIERALDQGVSLEEPVVQLAEGAAGVGDHVRREAVDRLELRQVVGVVEVAHHRQRLRHQLLERRQLERPNGRSGRGAAARGLVDPRDRAATVGEVQQRSERRDDRYLTDVERRAEHRDRRDREVRVRRGREEREGAAERPADHVHRLAHRHAPTPRGRRSGPPPRPSAPCRGCGPEGDRAVLHEVRRPSALHEVLDEGAATTQVVAERRRRQRGHQQHRVAVVAHVGGRPVVVDLAQRALVDEGARHRA